MNTKRRDTLIRESQNDPPCSPSLWRTSHLRERHCGWRLRISTALFQPAVVVKRVVREQVGVEDLDQVGKDNIFIFGLTAEEVEHTRTQGYRPHKYYESNPELKQALDMIRDGYFAPGHPHIFQPLIDSLLVHGDTYRVLIDFEDYAQTQKKVEQLFLDPDTWTRKSIINSANMGSFSSDRSIRDYCRLIWNIEP